jgi:CrcB protein
VNVGIFLLAVVGGGLGALLRFVVDGLVPSRSGFPWGTLVVNVSGSFALGLLTGLAQSSLLDAPWLFVLGGGVLGGYTTFSAPMVATAEMLMRREGGRALFNSVGMLALTVLAALAGVVLGGLA